MEKTIELTHEDRARLARLYEEAAGRLYEAALLISRNVGLKGELTGFQFDHSRKVRTQTEPEAAAQGTPAVAALVRYVTVGHRVYVIADSGCGYYDFDAGVQLIETKRYRPHCMRRITQEFGLIGPLMNPHSTSRLSGTPVTQTKQAMK